MTVAESDIRPGAVFQLSGTAPGYGLVVMLLRALDNVRPQTWDVLILSDELHPSRVGKLVGKVEARMFLFSVGGWTLVA